MKLSAVLLVFAIALHSVLTWSIHKMSDQSSFENSNRIDDPNSKAINVIFPGTKWCGSGSIAEDYNDLGSQSATDVCCREHDTCPDIIQSGETSHGLTNNALYTRLHCDCDQKFLTCLRDSDNFKSSSIVGIIYFDVLQTQCFRYDYPAVDCAMYSSITSRCMEYVYNTSAEKTWQWFDVPIY